VKWQIQRLEQRNDKVRQQSGRKFFEQRTANFLRLRELSEERRKLGTAAERSSPLGTSTSMSPSSLGSPSLRSPSLAVSSPHLKTHTSPPPPFSPPKRGSTIMTNAHSDEPTRTVMTVAQGEIEPLNEERGGFQSSCDRSASRDPMISSFLRWKRESDNIVDRNHPQKSALVSSSTSSTKMIGERFREHQRGPTNISSSFSSSRQHTHTLIGDGRQKTNKSQGAQDTESFPTTTLRNESFSSYTPYIEKRAPIYSSTLYDTNLATKGMKWVHVATKGSNRSRGHEGNDIEGDIAKRRQENEERTNRLRELEEQYGALLEQEQKTPFTPGDGIWMTINASSSDATHDLIGPRREQLINSAPTRKQGGAGQVQTSLDTLVTSSSSSSRGPDHVSSRRNDLIGPRRERLINSAPHTTTNSAPHTTTNSAPTRKQGGTGQVQTSLDTLVTSSSPGSRRPDHFVDFLSDEDVYPDMKRPLGQKKADIRTFILTRTERFQRRILIEWNQISLLAVKRDLTHSLLFVRFQLQINTKRALIRWLSFAKHKKFQRLAHSNVNSRLMKFFFHWSHAHREGKVAFKQSSRRVKEFFNSWAKLVRSCCRHREQVLSDHLFSKHKELFNSWKSLRGIPIMRTNRLRNGFRELRNNAVKRKALQNSCKRFQAEVARKSCRRTVHHWYTCTRNNRHEHKHNKRIMKSAFRGLLCYTMRRLIDRQKRDLVVPIFRASWALRHLHTLARKNIRMADALCRGTTRKVERETKKAFHIWHEEVARRKKLARLSHQYLYEIALPRAFVQWKNNRALNNWYRGKVMLAIDQDLSHKVKITFRAWAVLTRRMGYCSNVLDQVTHKRLSRIRNRIFGQWKCEARRSKRERNNILVAAKFAFASSSQKAWGSWMRMMVRAREREMRDDEIQACEGLRMKTRKKHVFSVLQDMVAEGDLLRYKLQCHIRTRGSQLLQWCFPSWIRATEVSKTETHRWRMAEHFASQWTCGCSMDHWQRFTHKKTTSRKVDKVLTGLVAQLRRRRVIKCWADQRLVDVLCHKSLINDGRLVLRLWNAFVQKQARNRAIGDDIRFFFKRKQFRCWHTLYMFEKIRRMTGWNSHRRILAGWRQVTNSELTLRVECLHALSGASATYLLRRIIHAWKTSSYESMNSCRRVREVALVRAIWTSWRQRVALTEYVMNLFFNRRIERRGEILFRFWIAWVQHNSEMHLWRSRRSEAVSRISNTRLLSEALTTWSEECKRLGQLRYIDILVLGQCRHSLARKLFRGWVARMWELRRYRVMTFCNLLKRAWGAWNSFVIADKRERTAYFKVLLKRREQWLYKWRQSLVRLRFEDAALDKMGVLDRRRILIAWHKRALQSALSHRIDRIYCHKLNLLRLGRRMHMWHGLTRVQCRLMQLEETICDKVSATVVKRILLEWRRITRMERLDRKFALVPLKRAILHWKCWLHLNVMLYNVVKRVIHKWRRRVTARQIAAQGAAKLRTNHMRQIYRSWFGLISRSQQRKEEVIFLVFTHVERHEQLRVKRSFMAWKGRLEDTKRIAETQRNVHFKVIASRIAKWHRYAHKKQFRKSAFVTAGDRKTKNALRSVFTLWWSYHTTRAARLKKESTRTKQVRSLRTRSLLHRWHRMWHLRRLIAPALATHVSAQKQMIFQAWNRCILWRIESRRKLEGVRGRVMQKMHFVILRKWSGATIAGRWIRRNLACTLRGMKKWWVAYRTEAAKGAMLRRIMLRWNARIQEQKRRETAQKEKMVYIWLKGAKILFSVWKHETETKISLRRRQEQVCEQIILRRKNESLERLFTQSRMKKKLRRFELKLRKNMKPRILNMWKEVTERSAQISISAKSLVAQNLMTLIRVAFLGWVRRLTLRYTEEHKANKIRNKRLHCVKGQLMQKWMCELVKQRKVHRCAGRSFMTLTRRAWSIWVDVMQLKQEIKRLQEHCRERIVKPRRKRLAVQIWHRHVDHQIWFCKCFHHICARRSSIQGNSILTAWNKVSKRMKLEKQNQEYMQNRVISRIKRTRLDAWRKLSICTFRHAINLHSMFAQELCITAFDTWKLDHLTRIAKKYRALWRSRFLRKILCQWCIVKRTKHMGVTRLAAVLSKGVRRSTGTLFGKLCLMYFGLPRCRQALNAWMAYVSSAKRYKELNLAVTRGRGQLLQKKGFQSWRAFNRSTKYQRRIFHHWRQRMGAVRIGSSLARWENRYDKKWWLQQFCSNLDVQSTLSEFQRLYDKEREKKPVPIEVLANMCWIRRLYHLGFSAIAKRSSEWPFWSLSAPLGSKLHVDTMRSLEFRMDALRKYEDPAQLAVLFVRCYQKPDAQKPEELSLASALCDLVLVTLGASAASPHDDMVVEPAD